ncbi:acyloxyacyl hydrolase [Marinimicrobium alkaliphilum]|uniref:acyloxyacyl hydrolase n=1 Tax=Marinimicrobium alkaliphilum TaxID=2202654 RepID=UPI000DB9C09C|nr:acyloxyacyl hydrolase [Marinimicrobium alkaliphilum]
MAVVRWLAPLALGLTSFAVQADELHLGVGIWKEDVDGVRLAYRSSAYDAVTLPNWLGSPRLYAEYSVSRPRIRPVDDERDALWVYGISPVLQWHIAGEQRPLYIEGGIGAAFVSDTRIGHRLLSTHFQFEDILRFSWQFSPDSSARFSLMYVHYSNGRISSPNMGINLGLLSLSVPL